MFRRVINVPVTVVSYPLGNCSFKANWTLSTDGALQAKNISLLHKKKKFHWGHCRWLMSDLKRVSAMFRLIRLFIDWTFTISIFDWPFLKYKNYSMSVTIFMRFWCWWLMAKESRYTNKYLFSFLIIF